MAERQIPRALPEATTGVGGEAQALQRRRGGVLLLRPPHSSVFIIHKVAADKDLLWNVMNRDKKEELKLFCGMYFIHFQVISVIRLRISVKKKRRWPLRAITASRTSRGLDREREKGKKMSGMGLKNQHKKPW